MKSRPFETYIRKAGECLEWTGGTVRDYGYYKGMLAHRYAWENQVGPIPDGMLVLHRCNNPPCVNVAHLYIGTSRDNAADTVKAGRHYSHPRGKTHCYKGHEFSEENTILRWRQHYMARICRTCLREYYKLYRKKQKQRASDAEPTPAPEP